MNTASKPVISVIVPAFRPADFADLRSSMAANADVAAEWIVVDDGSGHDHAALFSDLAAEGVRIMSLPENRRQAAARNAGLASARGEWVKFLDADDRLDPGHLAALLAASDASARPEIIAFSSTCHVHPSGPKTMNLSWQGLAEIPEAQLERMIAAPFLSHCGPLFPRALLQRLGGYDESLCTDEDGDLLIRVLQAGARFRAVPGVFYHYQHHDGAGRVSRDDSPAKLAARRRVCEKVIAAAGPGGLSPGLRRALAQRLDRIALSFWRSFPQEARMVLSQARALAPNYRPTGPLPVRMARQLAGPGAGLAVEVALRGLRQKLG